MKVPSMLIVIAIKYRLLMCIERRMQIFNCISEVHQIKFNVHFLHLKQHWNYNLQYLLIYTVNANSFGANESVLVAI